VFFLEEGCDAECGGVGGAVVVAPDGGYFVVGVFGDNVDGPFGIGSRTEVVIGGCGGNGVVVVLSGVVKGGGGWWG